MRVGAAADALAPRVGLLYKRLDARRHHGSLAETHAPIVGLLHPALDPHRRALGGMELRGWGPLRSAHHEGIKTLLLPEFPSCNLRSKLTRPGKHSKRKIVTKTWTD